MTTQRKQGLIYRRMIKEFVVLIIVIVSSGCSTTKPNQWDQSPCIDKMEDLPIDWQPSPNIRETLSNEAWTSREQKRANRAVIHGLDEMVEYQLSKPETVTSLWDNSVEAYIDTAYAADNMPTLRDKALSVAQRHLMVIATPYTKPENAVCADVSTYLTLVIYAHSLSQRLDNHADLADLQGVLVDKTNQSLEDCGSLNTLMGYDYRLFLGSPKTLNGDVYDMVMWSILFIDALTITALNLPDGVESSRVGFMGLSRHLPHTRCRHIQGGGKQRYVLRFGIFDDPCWLRTNRLRSPCPHGSNRALAIPLFAGKFLRSDGNGRTRFDRRVCRPLSPIWM